LNQGVVSPRAFVICVGGVLFALALFLLYRPVSVPFISGHHSIPCGSAGSSNLDDASHQDDLQDLRAAGRSSMKSSYVRDCEAALSSRKVWVLPLGGAGLLLAAFGALALPGRRPSPPASDGPPKESADADRQSAE
jgi:hypothetical protein